MSERLNEPRRPAGQPGGDSQRASGNEPSIGELVGELVQDTQRLLKQELALAKTELTQSAKQAAMGVVKLVVAGLLVYAGFLVLLFAAVFGLRELDLPWSLSALIVGVVVLVVGAILVAWARADMKKTSLAPTETIESLQEDREWAKGQVQ